MIEDMLQALMIYADSALGSIQIVPPNFKREHDRIKFQIMRRIILFMNLELSRCIGDNLILLHEQASQTLMQSVTIYNGIVDSLGMS
jgi:hypothetical protein